MILWRFYVGDDNMNIIKRHVNCPIFLPDVHKISIVDRILLKPPISNFKHISLVGVELTDADGQTDMTKLRGAFPDSC